MVICPPPDLPAPPAIVAIAPRQNSLAAGVLPTGASCVVEPWIFAGIDSVAVRHAARAERTVAQASLETLGGWPRQQGRPLAESSPWNTPIPVGAQYVEVPGLARYDIGLTSWIPDGASVALYRATTQDPLVPIRWVPDSWQPVHTGQWARWGNPPLVETAILAASKPVNPYPGNPYSTQHAERRWNSTPSGLPPHFARWRQTGKNHLTAHVPAGALPTPDGDGVTVVVQPNGWALEMYSPVKLASGTWISQMYTLTDAVNGLGVGAENGRRASMVPSYAGVLTEADLAGGPIRHALAVLAPASLLTTAFVGPALAFDSNPNYSGSLPMGARLALPRDLDLRNLGLSSRLGRLIAEAAQDYGLYLVDRGGGGISIITEHAPGSALLSANTAQEQTDLIAILGALRACRLQQGSRVTPTKPLGAEHPTETAASRSHDGC